MEVKVNDRVIDFVMRVGDAGEAYFVLESSELEGADLSPLTRPLVSVNGLDGIHCILAAQGTF